jgi:hypothetical protein
VLSLFFVCRVLRLFPILRSLERTIVARCHRIRDAVTCTCGACSCDDGAFGNEIAQTDDGAFGNEIAQTDDNVIVEATRTSALPSPQSKQTSLGLLLG